MRGFRKNPIISEKTFHKSNAMRPTFVVSSQPRSHFTINKYERLRTARMLINHKHRIVSYFFSSKTIMPQTIYFYFNKYVMLSYSSMRLYTQQQSLHTMFIWTIFNSYRHFNFFFSINNQLAYYQFFFFNKTYLLQKIKNFYSISKIKRTYRMNYFNINRASWKTSNHPMLLNKQSATSITRSIRKFFSIKSGVLSNAYSVLKNASLMNFSQFCCKLRKYRRWGNYLYFYYLKTYILTIMKLKQHYNLIFARTFSFKPEMFFAKYFIYSAKRLSDDSYCTNPYTIFFTAPINLHQKIIYYRQRFNANNALMLSNFFFFNLSRKNIKNTNPGVKRWLSVTPYKTFQTALPLAPNLLPKLTSLSYNDNKGVNKSLFLNLSCLEFLFTLIFKPIFFKYFLFLNAQSANKFITLNRYVNGLKHYCKKFFFYSTTQGFFFNNLIPNAKFSYIFKKKIVRVFSSTFFFIDTAVWYYHTIVRFLEFCSGKKACVRIAPFLMNALTFYEKFQCVMWAQRVRYYRKVLGPRLFLSESLQIMYLALKFKDPFLLSNWMTAMMYKISFWKYKTFLRYIKYAMRCFFWVLFKELNVKGIKYQLKGKISVAGNARTRTAFHYVGCTSHGTFNNKILYNLNLVRTFTGVLGLKLWIVF